MADTTLQSSLTRDEALALLKTYNKDTFHIRHALTVEGVMRWYAKELEELFARTFEAMRSCEDSVEAAMEQENA